LGTVLNINRELFQKAKRLYQQKQYLEAIKIYRDIILRYSKSYKAWNNLGLCYVRLNDYINAIQYFQQAITLLSDASIFKGDESESRIKKLKKKVSNFQKLI